MTTSTFNSKLWKEIFEQPTAIQHSLAINRPIIAEIAAKVRERKLKNVVLIGRGSSDHANILARYLFEIHTDMIAMICAPSVITAYSGKVDYSDSLVIGVSQSGGARDVYEVMKHAKQQGALTVSITNVRGSLMTTVGDYHLNNECGPETSVTAAKSYMTQITLLSCFVAEISQDPKLLAQMDQLSDIVKDALALVPQVETLVPYIRNCDKVLLFGRGLLHALTLETELKIQETSYFDARAYASSDYRHGPIATSQRIVPAIFFIADPQTDYCPIDLLKTLKKQHVNCIVVSGDPAICELGDQSVLLPNHVVGLPAVFAGAVFSQMFSCLLSIARGYNPDEPVGVSKNTVTL